MSGKPNFHGHVHETTDTQQARCDDAHDKKIGAADFKFAQEEGDDSLKWAVGYSTKANKNPSNVVHCSRGFVHLPEKNWKR